MEMMQGIIQYSPSRERMNLRQVRVAMNVSIKQNSGMIYAVKSFCSLLFMLS